jgi:DNA transformation protein
MGEPKGDHLYVNLGVSQAKKRLRGFGHGVRKVQTAGRHQALIIHTALGRNLLELQALFADVGYAATEGDLSQPIENLRNIGLATAQTLRQVEIGTIGALVKLGAVLAYQRWREHFQREDLQLLFAIAAGIKDWDVRELAEADKAQLLDELSGLARS